MTIRSVLRSDRTAIASLIYFERHVHRHLDWRSPLDWIERQPFVILEENDRIMAALACPPDPPEIAWIRLFAVSEDENFQNVWNPMWDRALQILKGQVPNPQSAAIPLSLWFRSLLEGSGFHQTNQIIILKWMASQIQTKVGNNLSLIIRPMTAEDLPRVAEIDAQAFQPPWQVSQEGIAASFHQAALAMVAESAEEIVGYQISTAANNSGHLARLAVAPQWQHKGIGKALVGDLQCQFYEQGYDYVTVNTQEDNQGSLLLYENTGFQITGESYPLYEFP